MKSLIKKILIEESIQYLKESQEYLNSLLDKISEKGMESLTDKEKNDLIRLSKGQSIEREEEPVDNTEEEVDLSKLFMHYVMQYEEVIVDEKTYSVQPVEEMSGEHIEVTGPDVDFICSPFFEGHQGIPIQMAGNQAIMLKVEEYPATPKEMMLFVQKFYEVYLPKIIRKVSSLGNMN